MLISSARPNFTTKPTVTLMPPPPRFFLDEEYDARQICHRLFGRMLLSEELIALCGGDSRTTEITVGTTESGLYLEYHHVVSDCVGACLIRRTTDSQLTLINEHVRFLRRDDIAMRKHKWFSRQKAACKSLGISTIQITGTRSSISHGYYYYPLLGFDAPLPPEFSRYLTKELSHCQTLLKLYEHHAGREAWLKHGCPVDMIFDLQCNKTHSEIMAAIRSEPQPELEESEHEDI